jgi:capsular polysaccharide biosynthesis protein
MHGGDLAHNWCFASVYDDRGPIVSRLRERIRFADAGDFRLSAPVFVASDSAAHEQGVYWAFETARLCPVPAVDLLCVEDAIVTQEGVIFLPTGECVTESLYPWTSENVKHRFGSLIRRMGSTASVRDAAGSIPEVDEVVHLREPGESGYFHWINSVLPRVALLDRVASFRDTTLAVDPAPNFAGQSLAALGLADRRLLPRDTAFRVKRLWMTTPTNLRGDHFTRHPFWTQEVRRRMAPERRDRAGRMIYLSRNDSKVRRVINEKEVIDVLAPLGFEVVTTTGMPMAEQIALFNSARVLLSPHGAGLSNAIFMSDGLVVEIVSRSRLWPTFRTLAARSSLQYAAYISAHENPRPADVPEGNEDIIVDIPCFKAFCGELAGLFQAHRG